MVAALIPLAIAVAILLGFPSTWIEWSAFDSIAICRITLLDDGNADIPGDLLEQIKRGQIWRTVTPTFIHLDIIHLSLNIVLVYLLAAPVESQLGSGRFLFLVTIVAMVSNLVQSQFSQLPFGGMSVIWCGMLGFRAMFHFLNPDSRIAPWPWLTWIGILGVAIGVVTGLNPIADLRPDWFPRIANAGHVAGVITGVAPASIPLGLTEPAGTRHED